MLNVAFIGFGRRAKTIFGFIENNANVVGFFDCSPVDALGVTSFYSPDALLSVPDLDVVVITTPPGSHMQYLCLCEKFGVPVICEKPLVINKTEVDLVKNLKIKVYPAFQFIFSPYFKKIFELIGTDEVIDVYAEQRVFLSSHGWRMDVAQSGGGTLFDNASHFLHLFLFYFGLPKQVVGEMRTKDGEIESAGDIVIRYPDFDCRIHTDWLSPIGKKELLSIHLRNALITYSEEYTRPNLRLVRTNSETSATNWMVETTKTFYMAKGMERDILKDPKNIAFAKDPSAIMLEYFLEDITKQKDVFYEKLLSSALQTSEIISMLYKQPNQRISL